MTTLTGIRLKHIYGQDLPDPLREALQGLREDPSLRPQPDEPKRSFFGRVRDAFTSQGS